MKAISAFKNWFPIAFLIFCLSACSVTPCFFPQYSRAGLQFLNIENQIITRDTLSKIAIQGLSDSIPKVFRNGIYELPLNNNLDSTFFICTTKAGRVFSFKVAYNTTIGLSTPECGYINYFDNLAVIQSSIPSIRTVNSQVDTTLKPNIQISLLP